MTETREKGAPGARSRRAPIVPVLAVIALGVAVVPAVLDTIETGRVYLFSREFLEDLPRRFQGTGRLRFIVQPTLAVLLGLRGGLADARAGDPPYLMGIVLAAGRRRELLRGGMEAIASLLAMGVILDLVFQIVLYRAVHPGAALVIGPVLICAPYAISRAVTNRIARRRLRGDGS